MASRNVDCFVSLSVTSRQLFERWIAQPAWQQPLPLSTPATQAMDSTIHWINHYRLDCAIGFPNTYPIDSDLSDG